MLPIPGTVGGIICYGVPPFFRGILAIMSYRWIIASLMLLAVALWSCDAERRDPVRVFAASSLLEPLEKTVEQYHQAYPGGRQISLTVAGSQELAAQILEGAPADLFLSADERQMERIADSGMLRSVEVERLFENELLLVVRREYLSSSARSRTTASREVNERQVERILSRPSLRLLLADPLVPLGAYTMRYLQQEVAESRITEEDRERLLRNALSFEASARIVAVKLEMGAGDGAFLYRSDALGLDRREFVSLEPAGAPRTHYLGALLTGAERKGEADRFLSYLRQARRAKEQFASYGIEPYVE